MENATEAKLTLEGAPAGATIVNSNYSAISKATNNAKIYVQIPEEKVREIIKILKIRYINSPY